MPRAPREFVIEKKVGGLSLYLMAWSPKERRYVWTSNLGDAYHFEHYEKEEAYRIAELIRKHERVQGHKAKPAHAAVKATAGVK